MLLTSATRKRCHTGRNPRQLAIADCELRLGQTDKALEKYQAVLKLSPDHARAKRIVAGLTAARQTAAQKLALVQAFLKIGAWTQAEMAAQRVIADPSDPATREPARLALTQARLYAGDPAALDEAVRLIQGGQFADDGRVLAALSLLNSSEPVIERASALLKELPAPPPAMASWAPLAELAQLLITAQDEHKAAVVSGKLAGKFDAVPNSPLRTAIVNRFLDKLVGAARKDLANGDWSGAIAIIWPMVSGGELPKPDAPLKTVDLKGGWLDPKFNKGQAWAMAGQLLGEAGNSEFKAVGPKANLLGPWLATQVLLQATETEASSPVALELAANLANLSRPSADRKSGDSLSRADAIQAEFLRELISSRALTAESQQMQWIDLAAALMTRYEASGDAERGVAEFGSNPWNARAVLYLSMSGEPRHRWLAILADKYASLGAKKFQEAVATLAPDANKQLNFFDQTALWIAGELLARRPDDKAVAQQAQAIIERYLAAEQFVAATDATKTLYAQQPGKAGDWALLRLKLRRVQLTEQKLLAGDRQLPKELDPLAKEALAAAFKELTDNPTKENRHAVIRLLDSLVHRYASLERRDLADAVIGLVTEAKLTQLDDWIVWTKANLQGREAARSFAAAVGQATEPGKLTLVDLHKAELDLLIQLVGKYPDSDYFSPAVGRVSQLSELYQQQRAFDAATGILATFLKAQPNLKIAPQLEFQSLQILLAKAGAAFDDRKDKVKPPEKLSAEFQAAIDAIAAYLKAHPTGDQSPAVLNELLQIARTYGQAGAWPVAREVLAGFAAAAPDFRSPGQLKLWQAATYLGELDLNYGLALLTPLPPQTSGGGHGDGVLAMDGEDGGFGVGGIAGSPTGDGKTADSVTKAKAPGLTATGGGTLTLGGNSYSGGTVITNGGSFGDKTATTYNGLIGSKSGFDVAGDDMPADVSGPSANERGDVSLALIRQAEQKQLSQIAMLHDHGEDRDRFAQAAMPQAAPAGQTALDQNGPAQHSIALPTGPVLSEAEMKRQDEAADKAYAILIDLVKTLPLADAPLAENARGQIVWMFAFFEGQLRTDRTVAIVKRFLADRPTDPQKLPFAFRALQDQLTWAGQRQRTDRVNNRWLDARHELFESARKDIGQFVKDFADKSDWVGQARLLAVDSFEREAQLAAAVSSVRSAGLLVSSVDALLALYRADPAHPAVSNFPQRMWNVANRLSSLRQEDLGVYVLSQIPIYFPTHPLAQQSVLRIATLHATNLANPLKAVETYQEYLSVAGDSDAIRAQIYSIAQQLAAKQRYLEALHVYGVFVDSFPTDARAPLALLAIGQIHQSNEVWKDALAAYRRILDEFPNVAVTPHVKLAMAECHINLSNWNDARQLYNEFIEAYPQDGQVEMARQRMEVLKNLNRYQTLLADNEVQRNKDDAQFQIGVIVNERLGNHVKAVIEFRKVVKDFPKSSQAAAAQYEVGKALLAMNKLDEARVELLKVPQNYPNSPFANDALYYVGQSYEHQAQKLAGVTIEGARAEEYEVGQRAAYSRAAMGNKDQELASSIRRGELKKAGKLNDLELDEAANAWRFTASITSQAANASVAADQQAETLSALQVANRQDRINDAYRQAVVVYGRVVNEYPLGDMTDKSLLRMAQILETELKDRDLAMQTYQKVVKLFPGTPVAEDAAWKVANFYEGENKYKEAVDAYRDFIRNYPASGRVPEAQFSVAEDLEQLGRWVEAMDAYETFRQKFAAHPKAQLAQDEINWIRAYRK